MNGDWVCYPEDKKNGNKNEQNPLKAPDATDYFNIEDLLNLVATSDYEKSIEITTESCFSGNMCKKAKEWIENKENRQCK